MEVGPDLNKDGKEAKPAGDQQGSYALVSDGETGGTPPQNKGCCCKCCECCNGCCEKMGNCCKSWWKWILGGILAIIVILIVIGLCVHFGKKGTVEPSVAPEPGTKPTTVESKSDMTTVTSKTDMTSVTPTVTTVVTMYPGRVIQGDIDTSENFTKALSDPSSPAYQTFAKNFSEAMQTFYDNVPYNSTYDHVVITHLNPTGASDTQVNIVFETRFDTQDRSQLDQEHAALDKQFRDVHKLGKFSIAPGYDLRIL